MKTSLQGDLSETAGGKLALSKSHNGAVRTLATTLVADHSKSFANAAKLARALGVPGPEEPNATEAWQLTVVATFNGRAFDCWYASLDVADHRQDISETADEVKDGTNAKVVANAKTDLPMLRKHLRLAEAALKASR